MSDSQNTPRCSEKTTIFKNTLQAKKKQGLEDLFRDYYGKCEILKTENTELLTKFMESQTTNPQSYNSITENTFLPKAKLKEMFTKLDTFFQEGQKHKTLGKKAFQKLLDKDSEISSLEKRMPFIYDCMGNTMFGSKHMEVDGLKKEISQTEADVKKRNF